MSLKGSIGWFEWGNNNCNLRFWAFQGWAHMLFVLFLLIWLVKVWKEKKSLKLVFSLSLSLSLSLLNALIFIYITFTLIFIIDKGTIFENISHFFNIKVKVKKIVCKNIIALLKKKKKKTLG